MYVAKCYLLLSCFIFFAAPSAASDESSSEFSLNIFTDLAPLLALFGEQFARQFMSETLTWPDHFIFAMVPLGILTAVIGAIRVSGPRWTRAIIGRSRETRAFAEFELMSSTSHEVCELFNGRYIVRAMGRPRLEQFILFDTLYRNEETCGIHTLQSALKEGLIQYYNYGNPGPITDSVDAEQPNALPFPKDMDGVAPNMQLNVSISWESIVKRSHMLLFFAFLSTILQLSVLIVSGFTVYNRALRIRIGAPSSAYGFPLFLAGTILLVVGMLVCSYTIEQSTIERSWSQKKKTTDGLGIIWLQRKQSVNDQSFDPFLIVGGPKDYIITSTRADPRSANTSQGMIIDVATFTAHVLALSGAVFGLMGFFLQFQGLRGLSWPSSVAQLIAIILMAIIRASVRYSLSRRPKQYAVTETFEIEWLSLRLVLCRKDQFPTPFLQNNRVNGERSPRYLPNDNLFWRIITAEMNPSWKSCYASPGTFIGKGEFLERTNNEPCDHETILKVRHRLGSLAEWEGPASKDAISLCKAIESVMNQFFGPERDKILEIFTWSLRVQIGNDRSGSEKLPKQKPSDLKSHTLRPDLPEETISFAVEYTENGWKAESTVFDAALSLWMSHLQTKQTPSHPDWLRQRARAEVRYWRVIGDNFDKVLERDLRWWINDALAEEIVKSKVVLELDPSPPLVIGFQGFRRNNAEISDGILDFASPMASSNDLSSQRIMPALAIHRSGALPNVLAQHVFSAFMWAVAAEISHDKIGSGRILQSEKFSEANITESWTSPSLQTQELTLFAQAVERTGLCSLDEAYISIIPPLSHLEKLPNEVIVNLARDREAGRPLDWDEISKIYLDILRHSVINQPSRYFSSIIAAAMEVLFLVSEPLFDKSDLGKICKEAAELKDALRMMLKKLGKDQKPFLEELQFIYRKQGRDLAFKDVLKEEVYNIPLSKPDYKIPIEHRSAWWRLTDDHLKAMEFHCSTGLKSSEKDIFGWTPLHYAVITGNRKQIVESKFLPILADMAGRTPVHYATKSGDYEILENLLGAEIGKKKDAANKVEREGMLPLHLAAQSGNAVEIVKLLLPYTNDVNFRDKWGRTALYLVAENGCRDIVEILLGKNKNDAKAEISIICDDRLQRRTALHAATTSRHHNILAMLAGKDGVGLKWKDLDQKTALELAVANDCELSVSALVRIHESTHIPEREINLQQMFPARPVPYQSSRRKSTAIEDTNAIVSRFRKSQSTRGSRYRESGKSNHIRGSQVDNETIEMCHWEEALDMSIISGRRKALVKMIELSTGTSRETTWARALRTAAKEGKEDTLTLILGHQVQSKKESQKITNNLKEAISQHTSSNIAQQAINAKNLIGQPESRSIDNTTADTTESGRGTRLERVISSLAQTLEIKALVNTMDDEFRTPLFLAASNGYAQAVDSLLRKGADIEKSNMEDFTPLYSAAASGYLEVVKILLAYGADTEAATYFKNRTPLYAAARYGHVDTVKVLLEKGANKEARNEDGWTPLRSAANGGHVEVVKMLLKHGADKEAKDKNGYRPLMAAVDIGHAEVVNVLLDNEADTDAADNAGLRPLDIAAYSRNIELFKVLLENGSNMEVVDRLGWTPLNSAVYFRHTEMVKVLLDKGANTETANESGCTPLNVAARFGNIEIVKMLIKKNANIEAADKEGRKPLHSAAIKGYAEIVEVLVRKGADIEAAMMGWTPLNLAANGGHVSVTKFLLDMGANTEVAGSAPLNLAAAQGHLEIVKMLLENEANIEAADRMGWTPLTIAAFQGYIEIVNLLVEKGANLEVESNGLRPLGCAVSMGHKDVAKALLDKGANTEVLDDESTLLNLAAANGDLAIVKMLLEKEANIEAANKSGWRPLHSAAIEGNAEIVEVLVRQGAEVDAAMNGWTPLNFAAYEGHAGVAKILLDKGANTEATDKDGPTPLKLAASRGHLSVVKMLLEKEADIEDSDTEEWRPLHSAALSGHLELFELLLEKGANKEATNKQGWTPLHLAARQGHVEIVNRLMEKGVNKEMATDDRWTPLHSAVSGDHADVAKALLDKGANMEATDGGGSTPLNLAAVKGHLTIVKLLLEKEANKETTDEDGLTPLNSAARTGHLRVVKLLLEKEAKIEATDTKGWTPLNSSANKGHTQIVKLLIEKGANKEAVNNRGWTPLNSAAKKGHDKVVKALLKQGASMEATDEHGFTPLSSASEKGHAKVVKVLAKDRSSTNEHGQRLLTDFAETQGQSDDADDESLYHSDDEETDYQYRRGSRYSDSTEEEEEEEEGGGDRWRNIELRASSAFPPTWEIRREQAIRPMPVIIWES